MTAAVVLAAGAGTRFVGPTHKLLAPFRGSTVIAHAVGAAVATGLDTYIVVGSVDIAPSLSEVRAHAKPAVRFVTNSRWESGQATSVRAGIAAASADGHDAVVIGLGDQPHITSDAWSTVAGAESPLAVAVYDGVRGHPVRLGSEIWDLLPLDGDAVGRIVMRMRPELVLEIPCGGHAADIDTVEDLNRWS